MTDLPARPVGPTVRPPSAGRRLPDRLRRRAVLVVPPSPVAGSRP